MRGWAAALAAAALLTPWPALAHGFHARASLEDGVVVLEVDFGDGAPPGKATVVVVQGEREVARGETDAAARFCFRPPAAGRYTLRASEPGLHRAEVHVEVTEEDLTASGQRPLGSSFGDGHPPRGSLASRVLLGVLVIALMGGALALVQKRGGGS